MSDFSLRTYCQDPNFTSDDVTAPRRHLCAQVGLQRFTNRERSCRRFITVGLDLAKNVFQVHGAGSAGRATLRMKLRQAQVPEFFSQLPPCVVAMERPVAAPILGGARSASRATDAEALRGGYATHDALCPREERRDPKGGGDRLSRARTFDPVAQSSGSGGFPRATQAESSPRPPKGLASDGI